MRIFEKFLSSRISDEQDKIIFVDLAYAEKTRGTVDVSMGIKIKVGGMIGTTWKAVQLTVEDDFSISEFINTCGKFKIQNSVLCGDNEVYIL